MQDNESWTLKNYGTSGTHQQVWWLHSFRKLNKYNALAATLDNKYMGNIQRTQYEILTKFKEQVDLLNLANTNFDDGKEISALNIATSLRVLFHDTSKSTSALTHIG